MALDDGSLPAVMQGLWLCGSGGCEVEPPQRPLLGASKIFSAGPLGRRFLFFQQKQKNGAQRRRFREAIGLNYVFVALRRRRNAAMPATPAPNSDIVSGSGTAVLANDTLTVLKPEIVSPSNELMSWRLPRAS
jgi:hypothetical protein